MIYCSRFLQSSQNADADGLQLDSSTVVFPNGRTNCSTSWIREVEPKHAQPCFVQGTYKHEPEKSHDSTVSRS